MTLIPVTNSSDSAVVSGTTALLATLVTPYQYLFISSTACWIKQGTTALITCTTNANMADSDRITIAVTDKDTVIYEYDKSANGVATGTQSWAAGAATAIDVAATLATAIAAAQPYLAVTNNGNGTLTVTALDRQAVFTEQVVNVAFTITVTSPLATAADGSMFVPANVPIQLSSYCGAHVGVIQDTTGGKASLTRMANIP